MAVNEFAEETGVFGLSILRSGRSRLESAFWIACTLFFAFFTVRDLNNLTVSYLAQETLSLTRQMTNTSITLDPPPTLGFSHGLDKFDFRILPTRDALDEMIERFIEMFENVTDGEVALKDADEELFELMLTMIGSAITKELKVIFPASPDYVHASLEWAERYRNRERYELIRSTVEHVYKRFTEENVNFLKLLKFIVVQICARANFFVELSFYFTDMRTGTPCTTANVMNMDDITATIKLSNEPLKFSEQYDYALVSWDANKLPQKIVLDLLGTPQTDWERENALLIFSYSKPERLVVSLGISAAFMRTEEKTSDPCSKTMSRYDCKQRCYISRMVNLCKCYPLYFAAVYPPASRDVHLCLIGGKNRTASLAGRVDYLSNCRIINASEQQELALICDACLPNCRTQTFVATIEREAPANATRNELKLLMQSFTFPLIEEKLALNFEGYISQFGGILGLYIGISFAALLHIPIFAIRKGAEHFRRRSYGGNHRVGKAIQKDGTAEIPSCLCGVVPTRECRQAFREILERLDLMNSHFERRFELIEAKVGIDQNFRLETLNPLDVVDSIGRITPSAINDGLAFSRATAHKCHVELASSD